MAIERYYLPSQITLDDDTQFSLEWFGDNYRVFPICPIDVGQTQVTYWEIGKWGHTKSIGTKEMTANDRYIVGEGCLDNTNNVNTADISRSLFDAPNMTPFEPVYFILFGALALFLFHTAIVTLLGRGWK